MHFAGKTEVAEAAGAARLENSGADPVSSGVAEEIGRFGPRFAQFAGRRTEVTL